MAEKIFDAQSNYGWGLSLNMTGKAPAIAKRIWNTYADALAYVNDYKDSAIEGLRLTVIADPDKKKNGVYYIEKAGTKKEGGVDVANNDGILSKVGPIYTQTATNYSEAMTFANEWTVGQLIKVSSEQTIGEQTYRAGFYIVEGTGTISALATSSGADADLSALTTRVSTLETNSVDKTTYTTDKTELENKISRKVDTSALIAHEGDKVAHITAEERTNWNNAYTKAETYVNNKITELNLLNLANTYDAKGAADTAYANAKNYVDGKVDGKFDASGAAASEAANALEQAKTYVDGKDSDMSTRVAKLEKIDHSKIASDAAALAVANVVNGAPETFDTLKEIADWIGNNDHAQSVADLVTDVNKLKEINHDAYIAADTAVFNNAKTYTNDEIKKLSSAVDTSINEAKSSANGYTDTKAGETLKSANKHSDDNDASTLASAKQYVIDNTNGFLKEDTLPIATESDIVSLFA